MAKRKAGRRTAVQLAAAAMGRAGRGAAKVRGGRAYYQRAAAVRWARVAQLHRQEARAAGVPWECECGACETARATAGH